MANLRSKPIRHLEEVTKPKVTIGVCVRNCEGCVMEALNSVLEQDFPHKLIEAIFVDDGSEDRTLSILDSYAPKMDMHVKTFHHEWKGLGPSRNVVVDNALGDYIVWVDGDMILSKDFVSKQVEFMERNPKVGIGKGKYGMFTEESFIVTFENILDLVENELGESKNGNNTKFPGTGGSIYRVKAIKEVGGFDERMQGVGEDQEVAYRLKTAGWSFGYSSAVFYEKCEKELRALWDKYFWYGYGNYALYCRNRRIFSLYKMVPPASLIVGLFYSRLGYNLTHLKKAFLLPFHFLFKSFAWLLGFVSGQINSPV